MAVVGLTTGPHAPDLKTKENMYGDAMVELTDHEDVFHDAKLGLGGNLDAQPAGIRPSDSWLDATECARERRGMHVTFQVQDGPSLRLDIGAVYAHHQSALVQLCFPHIRLFIAHTESRVNLYAFLHCRTCSTL